MRTIELSGVVDFWGECENGLDDGGWGDSVTVGGRCVACAIRALSHENCEKEEPLMLTLAHGGDSTLYEGEAYADHGGRGYSELTPATSPTIEVGGVELSDRLGQLNGEIVHLRVDAVG